MDHPTKLSNFKQKNLFVSKERYRSDSKSCINAEKNFQRLKKVFRLFNIKFFDDGMHSKSMKVFRLITLMNIYVAYLLAAEFRTHLFYRNSVVFILSLSSGTILVVILRICILKQISLVSQSLKISYNLLSVIRQDPLPSVMPYILYNFTVCFSVTIAFLAVYIYATEWEYALSGYQDYFFFGWVPRYRNQTIAISFCVLTFFLECLELLIIYTFPGVLLVLCCYQYSIVVGINRGLARRIKNCLTAQEALEEFLSFYAQVEYCMKAAETALSPIIFFVYGYILSCLFQATGALVTLKMRDNSTNSILPTFSVIMFLAGVAAFSALSTHTSQINGSSLLVRHRVFELLSTKGTHGVDFELLPILLIVANNYPKQVLATAWGFFALDGQFALKAVGGIITYAVIAAQISSH